MRVPAHSGACFQIRGAARSGSGGAERHRSTPGWDNTAARPFTPLL
jgi:hypothetical protein